MEINGIAHIQLTVNDLQRAMPFYEEVLTPGCFSPLSWLP